MDISDKRRHRRYDVRDVSGSLLFTIDVNVMNMSLDGMAVESRKRLDVGRKYLLKIVHNDKKLKLSANVVWCNLIKSVKTDQGAIEPIYRAGLEFEDVISDTAKDLIKFLEKNVVIKLENRLFGRFKVRPLKTLDLDSEYEFIVKKISLSGMSIETSLLPDIDSVFDMEVTFNGKGVKIKGRVVHVTQISEPEPAHETSHLGIEFVDMNEEAKDFIEYFISTELEGD
ncbi:PilZ domain protein [bacterium BMS3Abin07]|nr:PilZ domain protein [bacterium BMS3Abin07]GBE32060.1 PilZ domain protein [bacterium BMS3Bbin05]HDO22245.1 PilZ domain-containing protein [Nitrospirota bacterium]HDZ88101.1 PilZ domain-containing protein [Nitrospirota bacterium]